MYKFLLYTALGLGLLSCETDNPCGYPYRPVYDPVDGSLVQCIDTRLESDGIEDALTHPDNDIDPELMPYLRAFIDIAMLEGIDLSFIYDQKIVIKFTNYDNNDHVATAFGRDKDHVLILVHRARFANRTEQGRKYVMWHEFGHDILDLPHLENGMMRATAYSGFFKDTVDDGRQTLYLYNSLKGMLDHYKALQGDGVSDDNFTIKINMVNDTVGKILLYNKTTYEFYDLYTIDGKLFTGYFKGELAKAFLFDDALVIRDYNNNIILIIKR